MRATFGGRIARLLRQPYGDAGALALKEAKAVAAWERRAVELLRAAASTVRAELDAAGEGETRVHPVLQAHLKVARRIEAFLSANQPGGLSGADRDRLVSAAAEAAEVFGEDALEEHAAALRRMADEEVADVLREASLEAGYPAPPAKK